MYSAYDRLFGNARVIRGDGRELRGDLLVVRLARRGHTLLRLDNGMRQLTPIRSIERGAAAPWRVLVDRLHDIGHCIKSIRIDGRSIALEVHFERVANGPIRPQASDNRAHIHSDSECSDWIPQVIHIHSESHWVEDPM